MHESANFMPWSVQIKCVGTINKFTQNRDAGYKQRIIVALTLNYLDKKLIILFCLSGSERYNMASCYIISSCCYNIGKLFWHIALLLQNINTC